MSTQNTVLGILGGIAVGAIAGVLLAPEKGATTRAKIADKAKDLKDNLNSNVDTTVDRVSEKLDVLKGNGVDVTAAQDNGNTLYHLATEKQSLRLLEVAAKHKLDVNAKNSEGNTALHIAAMKAKDADILKFLIEQGADVKATTDFDESAYDLASENELLKKNNVSIDFLK